MRQRALAGAFYSPEGSPSAELGYDSDGNYVGTVDLGTITVTRTPAAINAEEMIQLGNAASGTFAAVEAGITGAASFIGNAVNAPFTPLSNWIVDKEMNGFSYCDRYGNWGGLDWSGGQEIRAGQVGGYAVSAVDQMDGYFKQHDFRVYYALKVSSPSVRKALVMEANHILYGQLKSLPEDPSTWQAPAKDPGRARTYRREAELWFNPKNRLQYLF